MLFKGIAVSGVVNSKSLLLEPDLIPTFLTGLQKDKNKALIKSGETY